MQFFSQTAISAEPVFSLNAICPLDNQNSFDAIQHDDALKRLFVLSLQNECFKL